MILLETHSGIFLAALVLIAMVLIVTLSLSRKIALKHLPASIILAASTIFWFVISLGSCIVVENSISIHSIDIIPFSTVFKSMADFQGFQSNDDFLTYYYFPQCKILAITFGFGFVWGILSPILFNIKTLKKMMVISLCTIIPFELLINLCYLFQISYENYYDTASYILLALGAALGWLIFKALGKTHENNAEENK